MSASLYMIELTAPDWLGLAHWYRDQLGLVIVMSDPVAGFVLLDAGDGRLAIRAGDAIPGTMRLTFEVPDLPAELQRLAEQNVVPFDGPSVSAEGYRRALIRDPVGHTICLFDWV